MILEHYTFSDLQLPQKLTIDCVESGYKEHLPIIMCSVIAVFPQGYPNFIQGPLFLLHKNDGRPLLSSW